ncbi:MAG: DNA cytosine methyltransferase [Anaerovoracaceae bacterium]
MTKYNVLDLFCGCGGLSRGFQNAGYDVILGIDNDIAALNTFKKNHKNSKVLNGDSLDTIEISYEEKVAKYIKSIVKRAKKENICKEELIQMLENEEF